MRTAFGNILFTLLILITINGCMTMKVSNFKNENPKFVLEEYFNGKTKAWGIFEDRFGNVKRQFTVDINGEWDGKTLILDEYFLFNDGEKSFRQWRITKKNNGTLFESSSRSIRGNVIKRISSASNNYSLLELEHAINALSKIDAT